MVVSNIPTYGTDAAGQFAIAMLLEKMCIRDSFFVTLCAGGDGTISGNANVVPEHFVAIYDAFQKGDIELARKLQKKTNLMIDYISGPNNMSRYKVCLKHRGVIAHDSIREPLRTISPEEQKELIDAIEKMNYLRCV